MEEILLKKMKVEALSPIKYYLETKEKTLCLNDFIGKKIEINYTGTINCLKCHTQTPKSFGQGFCYRCFITAPEAEACVLHPEKCEAHNGIARDMVYAKQSCLRPNYVYLSKTSNVKVGVTRESQIPTRWIDQGATQAIKLAKTPYRQLAGAIEVELKKNFSDKTSWQKMLKNITVEDDLTLSKELAIKLLPIDYKKFIVPDNTIYNFEYPMLETPQKIKSMKLDKVEKIVGILTGIKGQYLIFDNEFVFNVRSQGGYNVTMRVS